MTQINNCLGISVFVALVIYADPTNCFAQQDQRSTALQLIGKETDVSIRRGLEFLSSRQNSDGSFGSSRQYSRNVAIVSLAGLAFMAEGSSPERGTYKRELSKAVRFVLNHCQDDGFITNKKFQSHGPMYGHGFATLFLAECFGMLNDSQIKSKLKNAVQLMVNSQNRDGGWRYTPDAKDSDISVTVCQVMALRAARNSGFYVPVQTVDNAVDYIKRCQNENGGFGYRLNDGSVSEFPRSAAAIVALNSAGIYQGPELDKAIAYLRPFRPPIDGPRPSHYMYGHYYALQAMWLNPDEEWKTWYPAIRDELIGLQSRDGRWNDSISPEFGTAMACVILQLPNDLVPIFQK